MIVALIAFKVAKVMRVPLDGLAVELGELLVEGSWLLLHWMPVRADSTVEVMLGVVTVMVPIATLFAFPVAINVGFGRKIIHVNLTTRCVICVITVIPNILAKCKHKEKKKKK